MFWNGLCTRSAYGRFISECLSLSVSKVVSSPKWDSKCTSLNAFIHLTFSCLLNSSETSNERWISNKLWLSLIRQTVCLTKYRKVRMAMNVGVTFKAKANLKLNSMTQLNNKQAKKKSRLEKQFHGRPTRKASRGTTGNYNSWAHALCLRSPFKCGASFRGHGQGRWVLCGRLIQTEIELILWHQLGYLPIAQIDSSVPSPPLPFRKFYILCFAAHYGS